MIGYPRFLSLMSVSSLQALELFAAQNTFQGELSERAPDLIVLPIDHTEVGFHSGRTRNDSCQATAELPQFGKAYRAPTICEAHYAGLNFKLFMLAVSLWMAHLKFLNSLSRSVQSS
jgi:hypothetical protein